MDRRNMMLYTSAYIICSYGHDQGGAVALWAGRCSGSVVGLRVRTVLLRRDDVLET